MIDSVLVSLMMLGTVSTSGDTPYWVETNRYGLAPKMNGVLGVFQAKTEFNPKNTWQWRVGTSLAGNFDGYDKKFHPMVDELYASVRWKVLTLDLGMKHKDAEFLSSGAIGSLSTTGGSVVWTGNSRSMPGYTLTLTPWEVWKKHLWLEAAFGDYKTLDNRYTSNALVHNSRIGITFGITEHFRFGIHLDHYAMWGGSNPEYGDMPATFDNYFRMLFGLSGKNGFKSDEMNVIGNQLGGEKFKFQYLGKGWNITFQHDIPYDDKSGMLFHNFPDGVNTLCFSFDNKDRWVSDILYEFIYTKCQSGPKHSEMIDGKEHILGGNDNYFNNGYYCSGWTYYGNIIGLPLFLAAKPGEDGIVMGVVSNRIVAHHIGVAGKLFRIAPYRAVFTLTRHSGTYSAPFDKDPLYQFSMGIDGECPYSWGKRQMITFKYGIYVDSGEVLSRCFGATVGLCFKIY